MLSLNHNASDCPVSHWKEGAIFLRALFNLKMFGKMSPGLISFGQNSKYKPMVFNN